MAAWNAWREASCSWRAERAVLRAAFSAWSSEVRESGGCAGLVAGASSADGVSGRLGSWAHNYFSGIGKLDGCIAE